MKKSTVYLLLLNVLFAALAAYFALESSAFSTEGAENRAEVLRLRNENREVYSLKEQVRSLEKINLESIEDEKKLLEENEALKNSILVKDNDLEKMKLFSVEIEKGKKAAEAERSRAEKELAAEKARVADLEKKLEAEKARYDELNGELVRSRSLTKDLETALATRETELENLKEDYFAVETELKISRERIKTLEEENASWF